MGHMNDYRPIQKDKSNKKTKALDATNYILSGWFLVVTIILFLINSTYTDIVFLQLHSIDEYVFYGSVRHMLDSLLSGDLRGIFGFGFYQYGFIYFLINMLAAAPGIVLEQTWLAILAPRLISSSFAIGSLVLVYKLFLVKFDKLTSTLAASLLLSFPAFWYNATWFHPDWAMAFFVIGFVYFLYKDSWQFKKNFWLGIASYALAIAFKYQAITFFPILGLYIFYPLLNRLQFEGLVKNLKIFLFSISIIVGTFIVLNPYILHPIGWNAFSTSFVQNMASNAANHGSAADVTISDRITFAIEDYYMFSALFFALTALAIWYAYRFFSDRKPSMYAVVAITYLVNIVYLFVFVNKAWQHYYLAIFPIALLLLIPTLQRYKPLYQRYVFAIIIAIQLVTIGGQYSMVLSRSRDFESPDQITYNQQQIIEMHEFILSSLENHISDTDSILISTFTPLDYERLNIPHEQVIIIFGALSTIRFDQDEYLEGQKKYWGDLKSDEELLSSFDQPEYIVIRKDVPYIETKRIVGLRNKAIYENAHEIVTGLYANQYGYRKLAESDTVVLFTSKP